MVMIMIKSIWKITSPSSTPIKLNTTDAMIMNGVDAELNWDTMIRKIRNTAIINALLRKANSLACSSCSPVNLNS